MIDNDIASRLEAIRSRTGLSMAEQIRRAIDVWLETDDAVEATPATVSRELPRRRPARAPRAS
jgi:hypothetical protein